MIVVGIDGHKNTHTLVAVGPLGKRLAELTQLVLDALDMALWQRDRDGRPPIFGELVHHADAGSQYTFFRLAENLNSARIAASIGSVGDAYDNALMESTIGLFKTEVIKPQRPWKTLSHVELAPAERLDWYNHRRLCGEIGHIPPAEYEANRGPRLQARARSWTATWTSPDGC